MGTYSVPKITIVLAIFLSGLNKDIFSMVVEAKLSKKINDCQRCKLLTDSFSHWLKKTSRGKHEGGDAAWAETKLKNYPHSELRLIEIQEGLCSELQRNKDDCYALAEETEQVLETWWAKRTETEDFYSWFCIETLKICCPLNHFGPECSQCILGDNSEVCGGHGKCDGDGTRSGNGSCVCDSGFNGEHCQDCAKNFYSWNGLCKACHAACNGCSGDGVTACKSCNNGWQLQSGSCIDINECANLNPSKCKPDQFCVNKIGSFSCKECDKQCKTCSGAGPSNCTSCKSDHNLLEGYCLDDQQKSDILYNSIKRSFLYLGLLVMTFFIFRSYKFLASFVIIIVAVYVYITESTSKITVANVLKNAFS